MMDIIPPPKKPPVAGFDRLAFYWSFIRHWGRGQVYFLDGSKTLHETATLGMDGVV